MDSPLSVIFLGTSPFAVPSLETLALDPRFRILAVITQPDRPVGRTRTLTPPPVKIAAERRGLHVEQPEHIGETFASFRFPRPDYLVAVSYGQLLPRHILDAPLREPVNLHASLLPRWRGASPIHHALLQGDAETGVTVMRMVEELDAGPIFAQARTPILPRDTTPLLHDRLAAQGALLLRDTLLNPTEPREQPAEGVTLCHKLTRNDGTVDPTIETAETIDRKIRALTPWPGVSFADHGKPIKILAAELRPSKDSSPLPCANGSLLHLATVQPSGKKPMSGAEWARGRRF